MARPLPPNAIHVWQIRTPPLPRDAGVSVDLLSDDERERAAKYLRPGDRDRFIFTRAAIRRILAEYVGRRPDSLRFSRGAGRKPSLVGGPRESPPTFSASHTDALSLLAVTASGPIGVDVERLRPLPDAARIARQFFSENEVAGLDARPPDERLGAFFRCWTRKEAFVKALGQGLAFPLDAFDVSVGERASLVDIRAGGERAAEWSLHDLALGALFVGAVAARGETAALSIREWSG